MLVKLLRNHLEISVCDCCVVLRENSTHKAMQEDTVATQTNDYILAKPKTISFMTPVHYLQ